MARSLRRWGAAAASGLVLAACGVVYANRASTILRLAGGPDVSVTKNLGYVAGSSNPKHRIDVYAPKRASSAPVVLFVHGGYWIKGDKDYLKAITGLYGSIGVALARRGVVTFVTSYRLAPEVDIDGTLDDVMRAIAFTRAQAPCYGGDPARLFLVGHSAGGHLVALVGSDAELFTKRGMDPKMIAGVAPISAVWDIADMNRAQDAEFNEHITFPVFGRDRERWSRYAPIDRLAAGGPPFFVVVGSADYAFMVPQAERARDRLAILGRLAGYRVVQGNTHEDMVLRFGAKDDNMSDAIVDFVSKKAPPSPS